MIQGYEGGDDPGVCEGGHDLCVWGDGGHNFIFYSAMARRLKTKLHFLYAPCTNQYI